MRRGCRGSRSGRSTCCRTKSADGEDGRQVASEGRAYTGDDPGRRSVLTGTDFVRTVCGRVGFGTERSAGSCATIGAELTVCAVRRPDCERVNSVRFFLHETTLSSSSAPSSGTLVPVPVPAPPDQPARAPLSRPTPHGPSAALRSRTRAHQATSRTLSSPSSGAPRRPPSGCGSTSARCRRRSANSTASAPSSSSRRRSSSAISRLVRARGRW